MSFEKVKNIVIKDEKFWPSKNNSRSVKKASTKSRYFSFKDFIRAFQLMATPIGDKLTSKDIMESKIKFFSKLK